MTEVPPQYRPGVCNIGATERRRRYRYAGLSAIAAIVYTAGVLALPSVPTVLLLGLFVPLSLTVEFFLQARRSFCAGLGLRGRFDLRGDEALSATDPVATDGGAAGRVTDPAARSADRRYALRLTVFGVVGGAAGSVLVYGAAALLG